MSKSLTALLTAENAKRADKHEPPLADTKALESALLTEAITAKLTEQENAEINAIAAAYRLLDAEQKASVRAAAGL